MNILSSVVLTNFFNSERLANFFRANSFDVSAPLAIANFIQTNPDESFVVVPVYLGELC